MENLLFGCFSKRCCSCQGLTNLLWLTRSRPIEAAGQRLVGGGCVSVAGGGRPRRIGGQIQGQQHRWDRAAQSHQGNAGVRAAHRWGRQTSHTAQRVQCHFFSPSFSHSPNARFCPKCKNVNPVLWYYTPGLLCERSWTCMDLDFCTYLHG